MIEIYKNIPDYDGMYQVSNLGNVKSFKRGKEIILKPALLKNGYLALILNKNGKQKCFTIHKLVAIVFLNHIPERFKNVVDHINNNKIDNRVENLQIISNRENSSKNKNGSYSKLTGVTFDKRMKKWKSIIYIDKKTKFLGYFDSDKQAHLAYLKELKKIDNIKIN